MAFVERKYSRAGIVALLFFLQGFLWVGCGRMNYPGRSATAGTVADSTVQLAPAVADTPAPVVDTAAIRPVAGDTAALAATSDSTALPLPADTLARVDSLALPLDSAALALATDSLALAADSTALAVDSTAVQYKYGKPAFAEIITETNRDSMTYNLASRKMYAYGKVEVGYGEGMKLATEMATADLARGTINAQPVLDSAGMPSRSRFTDGEKEYDIVDSITYNLNSSKGKFRGVWMQEGDGFLYASSGKKMPDNSINAWHGFYTTCDAEHPHFGIRINRGKLIPGKKTIFQGATLVIEDVEIPFPMVPFGLFPMNTENSSGVIIPSFGEDHKGFYLSDAGYYLVLNDYLDLTLTGSVWSLGSWGIRTASRYTKRYRFSGNVSFDYNSNKFGDRGSADWGDSKTFHLGWSHSQDPKAKPGQTFTASVNFSSSRNNLDSPTSISNFIESNTSSSVSFTRRWEGTPFNLSVSARHSQNNRDSSYTFNLPQASFSMSQVNPFKFKNRRPGPERWYEKISVNYNANLDNSTGTVKEYNLFKPVMFDQMETTVSHSLPVSANFSIGNIVVSPSLSYREDWDLKKNTRRWDSEKNQSVVERVRGFSRSYSYSGSLSANTTIYGMYNGFGERSIFEAVRHTINPSLSFSFTPNLGTDRTGFYFPYQADASGTIAYDRYNNRAPGRGGGASASLNFTLKQTLEAKIRSDQDSTGMRKISIIDDLTISGISYNLLADTMKLSPSVSVSLRSTLFKGFNINLSSSVGITAVNANGQPINHYFWEKGSRHAGAGNSSLFVKNLSTSFNKSWSFGKVESTNTQSSLDKLNERNNPNINMLDPNANPLLDPLIDEMSDEEVQEHVYAYRSLQAGQYYDFSVPLTIGFNGSLSYTNNGVKKTITPTLGFNGNINFTPNWGISFNSGWDFNAKKLSYTTFSMVRDLHCMQMSFNWVPFGRVKSWGFRINVKASVLQDLKYEKNSSPADNIF